MTPEREKELRDKITNESWRSTYRADKTYMFTNDAVLECLDAIAAQRGEIARLRDELNKERAVHANPIASLAKALESSQMEKDANAVIAKQEAEIARLRAVVDALREYGKAGSVEHAGELFIAVEEALAALDAGEEDECTPK